MNKAHTLLFLLLLSPSYAQESPPLEAYGAIPEVSLMTISPSGRVAAYRSTTADQDVVVVVDLDSQQFVSSVGVEYVKPRSLMFVDDDSLLLVASDTIRRRNIRGPWEHSEAWLLNVRNNSLRRLLDRVDNLYPTQSGLGNIIGVRAEDDEVYMPAFVDIGGSTPPYSLFKVGTNKRVERVISRGKASTIDWFVDADGEAFIREDFDNKKNLHEIYVVNERPHRLLYRKETNLPAISPIGFSADYAALVFAMTEQSSDFRNLYRMSLEDGSITGPIIDGSHAGIEDIIIDANRLVHGVEFEGFYPSYEFFDEALSARVAAIQAALPGSHTRIVGWSDDFERLVVQASGGWTAGIYLMFENGKSAPTVLSHQRTGIPRKHIAPVIVDNYPARDGLTIPALITAKPEVLDSGNAPLIVMPHGGPASYDSAQFNWRAQFFASRNYVVLQPQFRGSDGFGWDFKAAGYGEWGRKMQTDLDDGVLYLTDKGYVDPQRVCIVGASYGGYAALAAGAFSPDLYRCHISINGVSDIPAMLRRDKREHGADHWIVGYWERSYGVESDDKDALDSLSPVYHAESFTGPVLLIHGKDDTVVPIRQSNDMRKALERAGKDVEFVKLRGEDHYLSRPETRLETLRAIEKFIEEHL